MKHDSKSCKGEEKYLSLCLYYLEHSVIDYSLNPLDDVLRFCFVLTMVIQPTSLKEKPDRSQKEHGLGVFGCPESQSLHHANDSYQPLSFDP